MHTVFALVMSAALNTGEPVDFVLSVHDTQADCMTAAAEQKIPGDCFPVEEIIRNDNSEIPAGF
ncbi:TPA: DUF1482 family protein [Citrobacter freundii]